MQLKFCRAQHKPTQRKINHATDYWNKKKSSCSPLFFIMYNYLSNSIQHSTVHDSKSHIIHFFINSDIHLYKGCDEVLTDESGEISSPSSPWNGQKCETTIVAPPGKKIHLDFKSFDLPADAPWAPAHCFYPSDDNVEVRFEM